MNTQEKLLSVLKAVKTMIDNEFIYDEKGKPIINIDEEITKIVSSDKVETPISRFNLLVNQSESVHSNLVCAIIELLNTTNGKSISQSITIDGNYGKINHIMLSEMDTYIILRTNDGDKLYFIVNMTIEDLISIGMLF